MTEVLDYAIIMGYDAEEDWWGANTWGHATDPYYRLKQGLREYIDCLNIAPEKFTLALPWYSWKIKCEDAQPARERKPKGREDQCQTARFSTRSHSRYSAQIEYLLDYENRVDSFGNSMTEEAKNGEVFYSDVEGSFYFHWKDPAEQTIWELWMNAIPGNFTLLEKRYQLVVDSGVAGLGLWTSSRLNYASENPIIQEYNAEMWRLYTKYSAMIEPKETNQFDDDYWLVSLCRKFRDRTP